MRQTTEGSPEGECNESILGIHGSFWCVVREGVAAERKDKKDGKDEVFQDSRGFGAVRA